ncbi:hypothetical protein ABNF65_19855 [Paenibacillus larvae]
MLNHLKMMLIAVTVGAILLGTLYVTEQQNSNTRTLQEVKSLLSTASVGALRDSQHVQQDPKDLIAHAVAEVIKLQKDHGHDIRINYAFLNEQGKPTEQGSDMKSVQFNIELLHGEEVRSQAEQRISLTK